MFVHCQGISCRVLTLKCDPTAQAALMSFPSECSWSVGLQKSPSLWVHENKSCGFISSFELVCFFSSFHRKRRAKLSCPFQFSRAETKRAKVGIIHWVFKYDFSAISPVERKCHRRTRSSHRFSSCRVCSSPIPCFLNLCKWNPGHVPRCNNWGH